MDAIVNTTAIAAAFGSSVGHVLLGLAVAAALSIGHRLYMKGAR